MSRLFSSALFSRRALPLFVGASATSSLLYFQHSRHASLHLSPESPTYGSMNPKEFVALKVKSVVPNVARNTSVVNLELGEKGDRLPVSSFVMTKVKGPDGKDVSRPYTPLFFEGPEDGELSLLVKRYEGGVMSSHIASLKPGDTLDVKGPVNKLKYEPNKYKEIGLVAGGTGITPMLQVLSFALSNPSDKTKFTLIFGNQTPLDVLLKDEIDSIAADFPNRFRVVYTVDRFNDPREEVTWKVSGEVGVISKDLLLKNLPKPSAENFVYVCGPPPMYKAISGTKAPDYSQGELSGALKELGWNKENVFKL